MKTIYVLTALSVLLFSCEDDTENQINSLGSEIRFSLAEYLEPQQQNLTFKFLTEKDFPCINYQIAHQAQRIGNSITITLSGIDKADVCLDAIGPATAFIDMGTLAEGEYDLTIQVGETLVNQGTLSVTAQAYELNMPETRGLFVENSELLRVPDNIIWGTVRMAEKQQRAYESLMASLRGIGAAEKRLAEGNYHYFDIDANGKIRTKISSQEVGEELFLLEFGGNQEQLANVLNQLQRAFGDEVMVRIYNARGEEFRTSHF